jgi:hypothetical protein
MSTTYDELFRALEIEVQRLAKDLAADFEQEAVSDGYYILAELRSNIEDWSEMLVNGDIDEGNFKSLLFAEQDQFKMMALRKAGLTSSEIEDFRDSVFLSINNMVPRIIKSLDR